MIPKDPAILLSFVNTKLRDYYNSFDEMCEDMELDGQEIERGISLFKYERNRD